jgi:hypothetical protein
MTKHHFITSALLLFAFSHAAARGVPDTSVFEGKLVDSLTDEMIWQKPDHIGISLRFLDISSPDPKEIDIIFYAPETEGSGFFRPGDLYTVTASKPTGRYPWRPSSHMADSTKVPLMCDYIRHEASSPPALKDSGIKKLSVFTGSWHVWNTDSADKGKLFADFTCNFSPDGRYLITDRAVTNNGAVTNIHSVYSYNTEKDSYSMTVIGVPGAKPFNVPIECKGDSLIYYSEVTDNGKRKYARTIDIFLSATSYIFLVQSSENGWYWSTDTEGKATKVDP